MRKIFFLLLLASTYCSEAQLSANILMPGGGIMDKQQLWNLIVTNTDNQPIAVQLQIRLSEVRTGQTVFVASTSPFSVTTGTSQFTASNFGPILYNVVNPDYRIDPGPTGLLPIGTFNICYEFLLTQHNKIIQQCQQINIPPLGPLLLTQPVNGSVIEELHPTFNWLPPSPVNSLNNLRYELRLVEVQGNQSGADAIERNIPVFSAANLSSNSYPYIQNTGALEPGKKYAWQILATNNLTTITKSETWVFTASNKDGSNQAQKNGPGYVKLRKQSDNEGYSIFWENLRFDYMNETNDNAWNIVVEDLTNSAHKSFQLFPDSTPLKRGQNLVNYEAGKDPRFADKHQYLLKVFNSNNETWQLRFEYRKPD